MEVAEGCALLVSLLPKGRNIGHKAIRRLGNLPTEMNEFIHISSHSKVM